MRILSGNWRSGAELAIRHSENGAVQALVFPVSKFSFENISVGEIVRIEQVTEDNHQAIGATIEWGLDAAVILGPPDNISATLAGGDRHDRLALIQLGDGRKALVAGTQEEIEAILPLGRRTDEIAGEKAIRRHVGRGSGARSLQRSPNRGAGLVAAQSVFRHSRSWSTAAPS